MLLQDKLTIDDKRRTRDGYLTVSARVAKAGNVQLYAGSEVGRPDLATVRVYRPADEVFSKDTMQSFAHRPVTLGHPETSVSSTNWRDVAKGWSDGEVVRDGDFIRVSMLLADAETIQAVDSGTRELSMGYDCDLQWTVGVSPSGEAYDAVQRGIRSNHIAVVKQARGGPELRIGDSATNFQKDFAMMTDADIRDMYARVPSMTIADAAKLPIFDNVRGLWVDHMPGEQYWAMVAGAQPSPRVATADQARSDHHYEQMVHDMTGSRNRYGDAVNDTETAYAQMVKDLNYEHRK